MRRRGRCFGFGTRQGVVGSDRGDSFWRDGLSGQNTGSISDSTDTWSTRSCLGLLGSGVSHPTPFIGRVGPAAFTPGPCTSCAIACEGRSLSFLPAAEDHRPSEGGGGAEDAGQSSLSPDFRGREAGAFSSDFRGSFFSDWSLCFFLYSSFRRSGREAGAFRRLPRLLHRPRRVFSPSFSRRFGNLICEPT